MTAKTAGKVAVDSFFRGLKSLRDHWLLLVFLATALFWVRDTYESFVDLPARVSALQGTVEALRKDIARHEAALPGRAANRSPALVFPGQGHSVADGRPGSPVAVRFAPAQPARDDCKAGPLGAYMIDAQGMWYSVETDLGRLPQLDGPQELAFGVMVHPRMAVGRAQFLVQIVQDCGTHLQIDSSPRLHFRVLTAAADPT